jgi:SAM-dependent methyltransferase
MHHAGLGLRVVDFALPAEQISVLAHDAVCNRNSDSEILNIYSGHLKGLMLESLIPVWKAMEVPSGLGLERGLKNGEFRVDDYDDSYFFGARVYKVGTEFRIYHPSRGDWEGWDVIRRLIISTMKPESLLDIGCARGCFLKRIVDVGIPALGIDMSKAAWDNAISGMQKHIKVGSIIDLVKDKYDVVTAFDVMEHIYEDDLSDVISTLKATAKKFIIFNICAAADNENTFTIKRDKKIPVELEWLAVSGHVTIRHRAWWKEKLEDNNWEVDEELINKWFADDDFDFSSWKRHNVLILKRRNI